MKLSKCAAAAVIALCTMAARATIVVSADKVERVGGNYQLHMSVWNCGAAPVEVDLSDLPWGENAIGLVLFKGGSMPGKSYPAARLIRDMVSTTATIAPKSSIAGLIDVSSYFYELPKIMADKNAVLFWTYNMNRIVASDDRQVGGMVLLHPASTVPGNPKSPCGPSSP